MFEQKQLRAEGEGTQLPLVEMFGSISIDTSSWLFLKLFFI